MPVPEFTSTETNSPIVEKKTPVITREVLQSYSLCKVKGYLKLKGERGSASDYETMMTTLRSSMWRRGQARSDQSPPE